MNSSRERSRSHGVHGPRFLSVLIAAGAFLGGGCVGGARKDGLISDHGQRQRSPGGSAPAPQASSSEPAGLAPVVVESESVSEPEPESESESRARGDSTGAGGDAASVPTMDALLTLLRRVDGPGIEAAFEACISHPEPGHRVLYEFLAKCDIEREKILALTHDPVLVFGLLRLVARRPDEVAAFCDYLMLATRDRTNSFVRREIFNFLPVFLNYHRGEYVSVRRNLEKEIVYQLEKGGDYIYKIRLAMHELRFDPPPTAFLACLRDSSRRADHQGALRMLVALGDRGVETTLDFIDEIAKEATKPGPSRYTLSDAVREVIVTEKSKADSKPIRRLLAHSDDNVRGIALLTFYRMPPEDRAAQVELGETSILEFLNGGAVSTLKQTLIAAVSRASPETIFALETRAAEINDPAVRKKLIDRAEWQRKRAAKAK